MSYYEKYKDLDDEAKRLIASAVMNNAFHGHTFVIGNNENAKMWEEAIKSTCDLEVPAYSIESDYLLKIADYIHDCKYQPKGAAQALIHSMVGEKSND